MNSNQNQKLTKTKAVRDLKKYAEIERLNEEMNQIQKERKYMKYIDLREFELNQIIHSCKENIEENIYEIYDEEHFIESKTGETIEIPSVKDGLILFFNNENKQYQILLFQAFVYFHMEDIYNKHGFCSSKYCYDISNLPTSVLDTLEKDVNDKYFMIEHKYAIDKTEETPKLIVNDMLKSKYNLRSIFKNYEKKYPSIREYSMKEFIKSITN